MIIKQLLTVNLSSSHTCNIKVSSNYNLILVSCVVLQVCILNAGLLLVTGISTVGMRLFTQLYDLSN